MNTSPFPSPTAAIPSNNPTVEQLAIHLAAEADGGNVFNLTGVRIFLESDGTAGLDTANDTEVTGTGLGYINLPRDTSATVYLVGNVPSTATKRPDVRLLPRGPGMGCRRQYCPGPRHGRR